MITNLAGCLLPCETESNEPILRERILFSSRISTLMFLLIFSSFFASFAKNVGVQILEGVSPSILALLIPLDIARDSATIDLNCLVSIFDETFK